MTTTATITAHTVAHDAYLYGELSDPARRLRPWRPTAPRVVTVPARESKRTGPKAPSLRLRLWRIAPEAMEAIHRA